MTQLVKRRVANPTPSVLALVNKARRKNMAAKKQSSSTKRRSSAAKSTKRRQTTTKRRNPVKPVSRARSSGKKRGGKPRRYARRYHNPLTGGLVGKAFTLAGAGAVIGLTQPFVGNFVRPYLGSFGASPIAGAGITFGTSWLLSVGAGMFAFTRKWKDDILLAGGTIAAAQLISAYVMPALRLGNGNRNGAGMGRYGMRGIGMMTDVPPQLRIAPPPSRRNGNGNGMQGVGMRQGVYGR